MNAEAVMYDWLDTLRFNFCLWLLAWEKRPLWLLAYKLMTYDELQALKESISKKMRKIYATRGKKA